MTTSQRQFGLREFLIYTMYAGLCAGLVSLLAPVLPPFPSNIFVFSTLAILAGAILVLLSVMVFLSAVQSARSTAAERQKELQGNSRLFAAGVLLILLGVITNVLLISFMS